MKLNPSLSDAWTLVVRNCSFVGNACALFFAFVFAMSRSEAQDIWEYAPYRVSVWVTVAPSIGWTESSEREFHRKVQELCEVDFGGTWKIKSQSAPDSLYGSLLYRIDEMSIQQVLAREMILVVGKSEKAKAKFLELNPPPPPVVLTPAEEAKRKKMSKEQIQELEDAAARAASLNSVRTFDSAMERIDSFHVMSLPYSGLIRDLVPYQQTERWKKFSDKVRLFPGSLEELKSDLSEGNIVAALIPKTELNLIKDVARSIPARLPWQPEQLLRDYDKIFLASIDRSGENYRIRVRELDSVVRRMSETSTMESFRREDIARSLVHQMRSVFSPVVRIEETDNFTATMRVKSAGLIVGEDHPAKIGIGDVVVPFIRRDDMNGNPTLLQNLPFTFIAATEKIDETSLFYGAIFSASRGALTAAKNRRTQRLGLKISASHPTSELKLTFRQQIVAGKLQPPVAVPGAEIYQRTPGHDDLLMLGRTDWRGNIPLNATTLPTIKYEIPTASRNRAIADARKVVRDPVLPPEYPEPPPEPQATAPLPVPTTDEKNEDGKSFVEPKSTPKKSEEEALVKMAAPAAEALPPKPIKGEVQINYPLYLYYVKNGDTLLARLPIVTGMSQVEEAKLPDDRKRLETEAFLKGLQNEVLDLVVRRKILESRINKQLADKKVAEAEKYLDQFKRIKSYEKLSEQIESIQRRAMLNDAGKISPALEKKIDTMVDSTRQIMQKWLQDSMLRDLELKVSEAK